MNSPLPPQDEMESLAASLVRGFYEEVLKTTFVPYLQQRNRLLGSQHFVARRRGQVTELYAMGLSAEMIARHFGMSLGSVLGDLVWARSEQELERKALNPPQGYEALVLLRIRESIRALANISLKQEAGK